eukprot:9468829-Pyramimonas_sp.AAC.1
MGAMADSVTPELASRGDRYSIGLREQACSGGTSAEGASAAAGASHRRAVIEPPDANGSPTAQPS